MGRWGVRKYGRMKDYSCASGRRRTTAPGLVNGGKKRYTCLPKGRCKVRWSKKRGRCKKTHSSKVGKMYTITE
jgi:hypothetical protein